MAGESEQATFPLHLPGLLLSSIRVRKRRRIKKADKSESSELNRLQSLSSQFEWKLAQPNSGRLLPELTTHRQGGSWKGRQEHIEQNIAS